MRIGKNGFEIVSMLRAKKAGWPGGWHWLPITYKQIWQLQVICRWLCFAWGWNRDLTEAPDVSKYCPAGKIECEKYWDEKKCADFFKTKKEFARCMADGGDFISKFEVCPWPSRQKPVDECPLCPQHPITELPKKDCSTCTCIDHADSFNNGYRKGQEEMKRKYKILERGLLAVQGLIEESYGVFGLHKNDDPAPWAELLKGGQFETWLFDFDTAIESIENLEVRSEI